MCRIERGWLRRASNIEENSRNDFRLTELPFAVMTPAPAAANGCVSLFIRCHWVLTVTLVTFRWWSTENRSADTSLCLGNMWQEVSLALLSARMHGRGLGHSKGHYLSLLHPLRGLKRLRFAESKTSDCLYFFHHSLKSHETKTIQFVTI